MSKKKLKEFEKEEKKLLELKQYLFCWDFDQTIIKGHLHTFLQEMGVAPGEASEIIVKKFLDNPDNGLKNPVMLLNFFRLAIENNHKIAITTFSAYPEVISPTLRILGLLEEEIIKIKIISGPPINKELGKLEHIEKAMSFFHIVEKSDVYLIDDSIENYQLAIIGGYNAVKVPIEDSIEYFQELPIIIQDQSVIGTSLLGQSDEPNDASCCSWCTIM